ncbi:AP2-like ethylene-responsive transcription factor AIL5 [Morus notabilis]|uniref:AP2-like ethylene-responsive transcription factor AIL5 n=1 Tax=Morus notabilis TaxID=981085 RepID=W9QVY5_9ROSA|nr:AP2-like ethylene-responsive transcription factor AIL5 [Morus notabilis]
MDSSSSQNWLAFSLSNHPHLPLSLFEAFSSPSPGGYDKEEKAARAYDLAALKYWGPTTTTNFPVSNYEKELEEMKNMTRQEFVASLRRKSSGFSRGASIYRGVTRHHQHGRWQARIGRVAGNKDLYLGTFSTQEEAAEAYDIAAIKFRGLNAVTNFDMSRYDVKSIASSNLPIGGMSNTNKSKNSSSDQSLSADSKTATVDDRDGLSSASSTLSFALPAAAAIKQDPSETYWSNIFAFQNPSTSTVAKNPSTPTATFFHTNPNSSLPLNMEFSAITTTTTSDHHNNGGFFAYSHHQQQQQQQHQNGTSAGSNTTNTAPFGMPISVHSNNNNSTTTYDQTSSSSGYNNSGNNWNNIGHAFHHRQYQAHHAKPNTLFQTPIFGVE